MRIAMTGTRGIPARAGGAERVVEELMRELVALGHDVTVFSRRWYIGHAGEPDVGRAFTTWGIRGKHLDTITHSLTATRAAVRMRPDVVHVHSPGPALWSNAIRRAGLPMVLTIHAPDWRRDKWSPPARWMLRRGLALGMRNADVVTAVSQPLADELAARFGREVVYIPNAAREPAPPKLDLIETWDLQPERYALFVGRIEPEKRLDLLLRAWSQARPAWPLVVVGELPGNRYGRMCRSLAGQGVRLVGLRFGETLNALYAGAGLVVQPSVLEGMSLVLLQAARRGRCILAADIAENRDALGDAVATFHVDSLTELMSEIGRLIESEPRRNALGARARALVMERYSWPAAAEAYAACYRRAMEQRKT